VLGVDVHRPNGVSRARDTGGPGLVRRGHQGRRRTIAAALHQNSRSPAGGVGQCHNASLLEAHLGGDRLAVGVNGGPRELGGAVVGQLTRWRREIRLVKVWNDVACYKKGKFLNFNSRFSRIKKALGFETPVTH